MSEVEPARIRPARASEAGDVLDVWRVSGAEPSISDDVESIERLIALDPEALIVAEADGGLVGTVISTWDGWRGGIYRLVVVPAWRRMGLGTRLVDAADARLRTLGAPKAAALVLREHDHAVTFWRAIGYERDDRVARWVRVLR